MPEEKVNFAVRNFAIFFVLLALVLSALVPGCAPRVRKPVPGERVLTHVVAPGETLEKIADDYYGAPDRASEIRRFNRLKNEEVAEGDVLRVYMKPEDMETLKKRERARVPYNDGLELVARGSFLDATERFRDAARLDPGFAEAQYNLGVTYQKLNAHGKALEALERALRLRPNNSKYFYALGSSHFFLERYSKAIKAFTESLRIDPQNLKAQYSLAVALEKDGKSHQALQAWKRYLELDSDSDWAARARSRIAELEP